LLLTLLLIGFLLSLLSKYLFATLAGFCPLLVILMLDLSGLALALLHLMIVDIVRHGTGLLCDCRKLILNFGKKKPGISAELPYIK
jgi:hypothetical protein